ncbi:glycoside hydrolase family 15 protein [Streptomyces sp. NPDC059740]|uniref:glycoside hydrolase family 15 protein n=1 Tax=Streptomyces sp. NPDC059740 TaxID=3346926 RepID=UPI003650FBD4
MEFASAGATASSFPPRPLREYALLADGERGALVGPDGELAWMCAPRWDSDAFLSTLVGGDGVYAVTPRDRSVWAGHHEPGTLIWRSDWTTDRGGSVESREALACPAEPHRAVVLRRVRSRQVPAVVRVLLTPRAGFGAGTLTDVHRDAAGIWTARAGELRLRWTGAEGGRYLPDLAGWELDLHLDPETSHHLVLEVSDTPLPTEPPDAGDLWRSTERAWAEAVPPLTDTIAPRDARQAYAVLRGLTSATGGMVAAATTSLPERAEEGRNYDYRYVWIRDQCYAGQALAAVGPSRLLADQTRFVVERVLEHGPRLSPAYTVTGGPVPRQRRLALRGYPGADDRVGNHVRQQFQLDAFGEVLLLLGAVARHRPLGEAERRAADIAADAVAERWRDPDAGVWELAPRFWTHSRLACVAGLRAVAGADTAHPHSARWSQLADRLVTETSRRCLHPDGHWQRAPDDPRLDGALLLPAVRGALPPTDPRVVRTLRAYTRELTDDFYAYRFRHDRRPPGEAEGAFLLCGFFTALAEHQQGDLVTALRWFERNRAACGPGALYSEEYDVACRQLRGNLPQAFVHALMLECAVRLNTPPPTAPHG